MRFQPIFAKKSFNPDQERDSRGRFGTGGSREPFDNFLDSGEEFEISVDDIIGSMDDGESLATAIETLNQIDKISEVNKTLWNEQLAELSQHGVDTTAQRAEAESLRSELSAAATEYKESIKNLYQKRNVWGDLSLEDPEESDAYESDPSENEPPELPTPPEFAEGSEEDLRSKTEGVDEWSDYRNALADYPAEMAEFQAEQDQKQVAYVVYQDKVKEFKAKEKTAKTLHKQAHKDFKKAGDRLWKAAQKLASFGNDLWEMVPDLEPPEKSMRFQPIFAGKPVVCVVRRPLWWDGKAWVAEHHPRDPETGKFIGVSALRAGEIKIEMERLRLERNADPVAIARTLAGMTTKQLRELKRELGVRGGRLKEELVQRVAAAAIEKGKTERASDSDTNMGMDFTDDLATETALQAKDDENARALRGAALHAERGAKRDRRDKPKVQSPLAGSEVAEVRAAQANAPVSQEVSQAANIPTPESKPAGASQEREQSGNIPSPPADNPSPASAASPTKNSVSPTGSSSGHKIQGSPTEEHYALANKFADASPGLAPDKRAEYTEHLAHALSKLPPGIAKGTSAAINHTQGGVRFHNDLSALRETAQRLGGGAAKGVIGFVNDRGMGTEVHLDGGEDSRGTYVHELWHAADNNAVHSDDKGWQAAYKKDIIKGKNLLSRYAMTNASEGFAEFGRALAEKGVEHMEVKFPNLVNHLKRKGLI